MLVDLLLMSEIKGYVHRPLYYFEVNDMEHRLALDCLLMVQGWRRYKWKYAAGVEPFELKYMPEQGIEVHGQVVSFVRGKPKPNMQVSSFLAKRGEEEISSGMTSFGLLETDKFGALCLHYQYRRQMESDSFGDGEREEERLPDYT